MSQSSCNICSYESFDSYNATLWAIQNPWFREYSSLAGALGGHENRGEAHSSQPISPPSGAPQGYLGHGVAPLCFDTPPEFLYRPFLDPVDQDTGPEPSTSRETLEGSYNSADNEPNIDDLGPVAELHGKVPIFCRIGTCLYWHTRLGQVRRHRGNHFSDSFGYWCPNRSKSCPSLKEDFRRRDAVNAHCNRSPACMIVLQANRGKIPQWGRTPSEQDLVPYDPDFHKPYRGSDGRTGHR